MKETGKPVTKEELIELRNKLIDMRERTMDNWGLEDNQTAITIVLAQAVLPISDVLKEMGCDLRELNDARSEGK